MKLRMIDPLTIMAVIWVVSLCFMGTRQEVKIVEKPCSEYYRVELASGAVRHDSFILQK